MFVFSSTAFAAEKKVTLELLGMYCSMCPVTIRTALDMSDGVESVKVSRNPDHAYIIFDDSLTNPEKLVKVVDAAGYGAVVLNKSDVISKK